MPDFAGGDRQFSVLITHMHWDHTLALPFFTPLYDATNHFAFYGRPVEGMPIAEAIEQVMQPPWFPIHFFDTPADKTYHNIDDTPFNVETSWSRPLCSITRPGVTAYRLDRGSTSLVVATDNGTWGPGSRWAVAAARTGCGLLIYDAQYLPDEYEDGKVGWGTALGRTASRWPRMPT